MPTEYIISRSILHLEPIGWICIVFGYLTMFFFGLPMYLSAGKTIPELTLILKLSTYIGGLIPMLITIPLAGFFSLDDTWLNDVKDILAYLVGGVLYGAVSGLVFWLLAYSWRVEEPKKD